MAASLHEQYSNNRSENEKHDKKKRKTNIKSKKPNIYRQKPVGQNDFMTDTAGDGESEVAEQPSVDSVTEVLESQIKDLDVEKS